MTRTCADCATSISKKAKRCKPCAMRVVGKHPDRVARLHAGMRAKLTDPAHLAKMQAHISRVVKQRTETALGWCPPERRDEWRMWSRKACRVRLPIFVRRQQFIAKIRADLAALSPFERQERALRNGAALVPNVRVMR